MLATIKYYQYPPAVRSTLDSIDGVSISDLVDVIPSPVDEIMRQFMESMARKKDAAVIALLKSYLSPLCVSAFGCDGISFVNERTDLVGTKLSWVCDGVVLRDPQFAIPLE